jgi:hypothetical protein
MRDLAEEVRATIDFFATQADGAAIERLLVTGGASQTGGLVDVLAGSSATEIRRIDPFAGLQIDDLGLSPADMERARATAATAVGLALWPLEPDESRLTILPDDVVQGRRNRRLTMGAAAGVAGLACLLGVVTGGEILAVHNARSQVHAAQAQVGSLQAKVTALTAKTAIHAQAQDRQRLVITALTGEVDWIRLLNQVNKELPPGVSLQSVSGARTVATTTGAAAGTPSVGTLAFTVSGSGGLPTVAAFLQKLEKDPDLQGTWVQGISMSGTGTVTFTSNSNLTTHADSNRAKAVQK